MSFEKGTFHGEKIRLSRTEASGDDVKNHFDHCKELALSLINNNIISAYCSSAVFWDGQVGLCANQKLYSMFSWIKWLWEEDVSCAFIRKFYWIIHNTVKMVIYAWGNLHLLRGKFKFAENTRAYGKKIKRLSSNSRICAMNTIAYCCIVWLQKTRT